MVTGACLLLAILGGCLREMLTQNRVRIRVCSPDSTLHLPYRAETAITFQHACVPAVRRVHTCVCMYCCWSEAVSIHRVN